MQHLNPGQAAAVVQQVAAGFSAGLNEVIRVAQAEAAKVAGEAV